MGLDMGEVQGAVAPQLPSALSMLCEGDAARSGPGVGVLWSVPTSGSCAKTQDREKQG